MTRKYQKKSILFAEPDGRVKQMTREQVESHGLNAREQHYVEALDDGLKPGTAAREAGFSAPPTSERVQRAVANLNAKKSAAEALSRKSVTDGFMEAIELAKLAGEPMTMIAGYREIGKMHGFYEPKTTKIDVSVNGQVLVQKLSVMSDEELLRLSQGEMDDDEDVIDV